MKFGVFTDLHFHPLGKEPHGRRIMSSRSSVVLDSIIERLNAEDDLEFVVQLGDIIQDDIAEPSADEDKKSFLSVLTKLKNLRPPLRHVVGNHDCVNYSEEALAEILGQESLWYSFEAGGIKFVTLYSRPSGQDGVAQGVDPYFTVIPESQLNWLQTELNNTDLPVIVFVHHSLADLDLKGSYWFEGRPDRCLVANREAVRDILEDSKKVRAVFNGHLHCNMVKVHNSIPYITVESSVEDTFNKGEPSEAIGIVEVTPQQLTLSIQGNAPFEYCFPWISSE